MVLGSCLSCVYDIFPKESMERMERVEGENDEELILGRWFVRAPLLLARPPEGQAMARAMKRFDKPSGLCWCPQGGN